MLSTKVLASTTHIGVSISMVEAVCETCFRVHRESRIVDIGPNEGPVLEINTHNRRDCLEDIAATQQSSDTKCIPEFSFPGIWAQSYIVIVLSSLSISQEAAHSTAPLAHEGVWSVSKDNAVGEFGGEVGEVKGLRVEAAEDNE